jgi:hypothetical protein
LQIKPRLFRAADVLSIQDNIEIVVMRHVIEHIHDPLSFMASLAQALTNRPPGRVLIETPCFDWILDHNAVEDIFYEHCNYWTADSLGWMVRAAGFHDVTIEHVFDGQYMLATAWFGGSRCIMDKHPLHRHRHVADRARTFGARFQSRLRSWRERLAGYERFAIWGAGAKGVTLAALIGESVGLDCLIDINPAKQGGFAPPHGFPIVSPTVAVSRGVRQAVICNPNYAAEIKAAVQEARLPIQLVLPDRPT